MNSEILKRKHKKIEPWKYRVLSKLKALMEYKKYLNRKKKWSFLYCLFFTLNQLYVWLTLIQPDLGQEGLAHNYIILSAWSFW